MKSADYKELKIWHKGITLSEQIYTLTKYLPKEELFGITSQLRRAAVSVPSNIAEGYGRDYDKEFIKFLSIARGSLFEVETQLEICIKIGYLTRIQCYEVLLLILEISKMINALITYRQKRNQNLTPKT